MILRIIIISYNHSSWLQQLNLCFNWFWFFIHNNKIKKEWPASRSYGMQNGYCYLYADLSACYQFYAAKIQLIFTWYNHFFLKFLLSLQWLTLVFKMKQGSKQKKSINLTKDFDMIMQDYQNKNPLLNQTWNKKGDFYEQYSLYDENAVTTSGILN